MSDSDFMLALLRALLLSLWFVIEPKCMAGCSFPGRSLFATYLTQPRTIDVQMESLWKQWWLCVDND
jgi:hypothetical protein